MKFQYRIKIRSYHSNQKFKILHRRIMFLNHKIIFNLKFHNPIKVR